MPCFVSLTIDRIVGPLHSRKENILQHGALAVRKFLLAIGGLVALYMSDDAAFANPPSFDCGLASSLSEKAICGSNELSSLDNKIARQYEALREATAAQGADIGDVRAEQRNWLDEIARCQGDNACLSTAYRSRSYALESQISRLTDARPVSTGEIEGSARRSDDAEGDQPQTSSEMTEQADASSLRDDHVGLR